MGEIRLLESEMRGGKMKCIPDKRDAGVDKRDVPPGTRDAAVKNQMFPWFERCRS